MAGEINGTNVLLYRRNSGIYTEIVGQLDITSAWAGTPIDISNKSFGDFVVLMDGELAGKQFNISGSIVYNGDSAFQQMRQDLFSGVETEYMLSYAEDKNITLAAILDSGDDSNPHGDKSTMNFSLVSSGIPKEQLKLVSNDGFNLVTSDGYTLTAGESIGV
jgi:hypothetical protein